MKKPKTLLRYMNNVWNKFLQAFFETIKQF